jgi:hypothetical protein
MRTLFAIVLAVPSLSLAACDREQEAAAARECAAGFEQSDDDVSPALVRAACACAVDRQTAGGHARDLADEGTPLERRAYRDHMPECLAATGGSATSILARESQGPPRRAPVLDPATGRTIDPNPPLPPLPGMPGAVDGPAPPPLPAPPAPASGESTPAPVPVAAADLAIVRNRSGGPIQCGMAGRALARVEAGDFDVPPGPHYCAPPVQPPSFELRGGHTYDVGPWTGGRLFVHDVTGGR